MKEVLIHIRNTVIQFIYRFILKPIFFLSDPEEIHDRMVRFGISVGRNHICRKIVEAFLGYKNPVLEQEILGIKFKNPVGLAAGFDKNAEITDILPSVGFGFAEVGSVTGQPCAGNPKPRLWRLKKSKSLVVYYGLKNDGCEVVANRLGDKIRFEKFKIPIGISVAMTNCAENLDVQKAIKDYSKAFKTLESLADYITVNISCPNAQGGQPFNVASNLDFLLKVLDTIPTVKPIFIKLSPDLDMAEIDHLLGIARVHRVHGIICSNLTKNPNNPKIIDKDIPKRGGLSGKVVQEDSDRLLAYIYKKEGKRFVLIGCGGISSAEDAYKKIKLGASLVQMITGAIFEGPQVISQINQGLARLLKRDGFSNLSEAIGYDNRG